MNIGEAGKTLIKKYESCRLQAYPDPGSGGDPWTIGWGTTGSDIKKGLVWTQKMCDDRFDHDIVGYVNTVNKLLMGVETTQNQFDALVSFHYNTGKLGVSTLLKKHLKKDYDGAALEFPKWNKAAGRILQGLVNRRAAEMHLYLTKD